MKIAVLGGGLTGLTAAYYLVRSGFSVTIFEKEKKCGGLAAGFREKNWSWYLEKTYHHLFANDWEIINFAKEIGFDKIFFKTPETSSLYFENKKLLIYPLDSPLNLIKFPLLSLTGKILAGSTLLFLKLSPFLSFYEKINAICFLKKMMGEKNYQILFGELFNKKFGHYAENILFSFFWARIKKRTKKLGYFQGGFQNFIDYLIKELENLKVKILINYPVNKIERKHDQFLINNQLFDIVVSTLPTPLMIKLGKEIFPQKLLNSWGKIKYLHALNLILQTKEKILKKTYWLNIATKKIPIMAIIQHTNFIDKNYYGDNHICYFGWYVDEKNKLWRRKDEEIFNFILPYLKKITNYPLKIKSYFIFRAPWAQPVFDSVFLKNKPHFTTSVKNFFIANLDMTYPYDRGTNYAVKLGKEIAKRIISVNLR